MRANELVEGESYILQSPAAAVAIYRGKHSGQLTLEDGSQLIAHANYLKFERALEGRLQVILVETGAGVIESESAKVAREREQAAKRERMAQAVQGAHQFMASLGFTPATDRSGDLGATEYRFKSYGESETVDKVELDDFTIGKLKVALVQHARNVLYLIDHGVSEADALSGRATTVRPVQP